MTISLKGSYLTVTSLSRLLINRSPNYCAIVAGFPFNLVMFYPWQAVLGSMLSSLLTRQKITIAETASCSRKKL
jgi:hypothetical protein